VNNPPSSFHQVTVFPSRSIWGLEPADLDSPLERISVILSGLQWQGAMFPNEAGALWNGLQAYCGFLTREFSPVALLLAALGVAIALRSAPPLGAFLLVSLATALAAVLNYKPPDQYIFYLPTYLFIAVAIGAGAGYLLGWAGRLRMPARMRSRTALVAVTAVLLAFAIVAPFAASRWDALRAGNASFVQDTYAYPLYNLQEPRHLAAERLRDLPENALLVLDWRALYATYYLAHVEQRRFEVEIKEALPHGSDGAIAETLVEEVAGALRAARPVFADQRYRELDLAFRVMPTLGGALYRVSERR
jgi:hypothetical protein